MFVTPDCVRLPRDFISLWLHESSRVYADKLMEEIDVELFYKMLFDTAKIYFKVLANAVALIALGFIIYLKHKGNDNNS